MNSLYQLIQQYGVGFTFMTVLLEQIGLPLPAYPVLVIAGALAYRNDESTMLLLAISVGTAILADLIWYKLGKHFGRKAIAVFCRISLSPGSCVRTTEAAYLRFGPASLLVAKFIPGFSSVANALAGIGGTRLSTFLVYDALGSALWAGSAIGIGALFNSTVDDMLVVLTALGKYGLLLIMLALGVFIANKWWKRGRFIKSMRMARISVDELHRLRKSGEAPIVVDVRPAYAQQAGRIPGSIAVTMDKIEELALDFLEGVEIIVYCACPNEVSAAKVAKQLMQKGIARVRPLHGGIDAWIAAGHALETS
jgi:membrane protein DedA with SNARE-associated domain